MAAVSAVAVSAATQARSEIFEDCAPAAPCVYDFVGPSGFGFVSFRRDGEVGLILRVKLRHAAPDTTYFVSLACGGNRHAETACPKHLLGTLTTNAHGNGSERFTVVNFEMAATGSVGHIDIENFATQGGVYVAGGITVPTKR